ncbi:MAG TPA: hypothetical protein GX693_04475, partial [Firmicutes bacterium]|nr:hypothetical protein [Bacillota bacterium]
MPDQFSLFSEAAALGFILGAYYDVFRALRACYRINNVRVMFITDSLFWFSATVYCLWYIFYYRWGEIYTYTYFGLVVGAAVYFFWVSSYLFKFWYRFFSVVMRVVRSALQLAQRAVDIAAYPARRASAG